MTHISHDDGRAANPRTMTDADEVLCALLVTNRTGEIIEPVSRRPTRLVDISADQHIALDVHEPDATPGSEIDILVDLRSYSGENSAETNRRGGMAARQDGAQKSAPHILAD